MPATTFSFSRSPTRSTFLVLSIIVAIAILQILFFPRRPLARSAPQPALPGPAGLQWREIESVPGTRQWHRARGTTRRFQLQRLLEADSIPGLELSVTDVVARRREDLQVASLTADVPGLSLSDRNVLNSGDEEYAIGTIEGRQAVQGCIAADGRSGVTNATLFRLVNNPPADLRDRLTRMLGFREQRDYRCLLITLVGPGEGSESELVRVWNTTRRSLTRPASGPGVVPNG